ncbi:MAG: hypothetical protein KGJ78_05340 [Alphaproteobacteria bacterium]|nr:hypothetical protein [Alphaproteobacteria bacterium]
MRLELHSVLASPERWKTAVRESPGLAGSLLLHGLAALIILLMAIHHTTQPPGALPKFVPIDLVRLGEETVSPAAAQKSPVPQQLASTPQREASPTPQSVSPTGRQPALEDALDAKLRALARLRTPDSALKLTGAGESNMTAGDGNGASATYSIRDYVRAQIERRWSLDLARLGKRSFAIPLRIVMKQDGTIVSAEIVDLARAKGDVVYRDVAISARNAALLSSPIALPPGDYPKVMHLTLDLNPRDTMR